MKNSFVRGVLSTRAQRQRFRYFRNFVSVLCAIGGHGLAGNAWGLPLAVAGLVVGYLTVAPLVAFVICVIEDGYF